ncbi:MAG: hypothetical protein GY898_10885 [Proteobacteria bacterium]|nr:hypothetical protein [Pseudomonadota bacterium]
MRLLAPLLFASLLLLPAASAHDGSSSKPSLPTLTEKEEAKLSDGKLLLWTTRDENADGAGIVTGLIEIDAEPAEIWEILLDFESIPETSGAMKSADRYEDTNGAGSRVVGVEYLVKVAWVEIIYSVHHDYFASKNYLVWTLDPNKTNGIKSTVGSFSTWPGSAPGKTRFLYRTSVDTGRKVPDWVEEDLSEGSLKSYIKAVRSRAEK